MDQKRSGDFSIGSTVWPGTSKLIEETGELQQVLGKLIATAGDTTHWSGDLRKMMIEEIGDVYAALDFFVETNLSDDDQDTIARRMANKFGLFKQWHTEQGK